MDPLLEQARTADGERRFFAPGEHPAYALPRLQLERLTSLGLGHSAPACRIRNEIAAFEQRQSDDKVSYLGKVEAR